MITHIDLHKATGYASKHEFQVDGLDLASGQSVDSFITFIDSSEFARDAIENPKASVVLTTKSLLKEFDQSDKLMLVVDDPRWSYFSLQNWIASKAIYDQTVIHESAQIHPTASIAEFGVVIDKNVIIEANATVLCSSHLGESSIIRAGAVVGTIGFEHKRTSKGILSVQHDGKTIIGERTEIGSGTVIAQGYKRRSTIIGSDVRIDGRTFIAHGVQIGDRTFIAAGVSIAGMTSVGEDAWIGLGALIRDQITIGNQSRVNIGAVVLRDVPANVSVLGNPARVLP